LVYIIPVLVKILAFTLILALGIAWIAIVISLLFSTNYVYQFLPLEKVEAMLAMINLFVLIGVPILYFILFILKIVYRTSVKAGWKIAMSVLWLLSLGSLGLIANKVVKEHQSEAKITTRTPIPGFPFDTIMIDFEKDPDEYIVHLDNAVKINKTTLAMDRIRLLIRESDDENFQWGTSFKARGATPETAAEYAEQINFDLRLEGNHIVIPNYIYLRNGQKWHDQKVFVTVWIPKDKYILLTKDVRWHHATFDIKGDASKLWHSDSDLWKMENGGLVNVRLD